MLDEQFFSSAVFGKWVNETFVPVMAFRGEKLGDELSAKFPIRAHPTVLLANETGKEFDRIVGYGPPPEAFKTSLENATKQTDTAEKLEKAYEQNPNDLLAAYKLAQKYNSMYTNQDREKELMKKIIDQPEKAKTYTVPYRDNAQINLYEYALYTNGDNSSLKKLIDEFPDSRFSATVYLRLSSYMAGTAGPEEAEPFFKKALEKNPDNITIVNNYLVYCARTKSDIDKGIELGNKYFADYNRFSNLTSLLQNYASLLAIKGDTTQVDRVYGNSFISRQISSFTTMLPGYINYWIKEDKNPRGIERAIDLLKKIDNNGTGLFSVAQTYIQANKLDKAIEIYGPNFIADKMDNAPLLNRYAQFWAQEGKNLDNALVASKKAVELQKDNAPSLYTLSLVYWKKGNLKEALTFAEKAVRISPNNAQYKKRVEDIKKDMEIKKK